MMQKDLLSPGDKGLRKRVAEQERNKGHGRIRMIKNPSAFETGASHGTLNKDEFAEVSAMAEPPHGSHSRSPVVTRDSYLSKPELTEQFVHIVGHVGQIKSVTYNTRQPHS